MIISWKNWGSKLALYSCLIVALALALRTNRASAQITEDGTLPNNSRVTTQDNIRTIEGGTIAGGNLFHSFQEFSVPAGATAFFNNAADVQNIISRVTGKSISNIDGIIKANGTANLFLINPYGIIFGANAQLNIGGSFAATTASAIGFGDQGFFSATNPNTPQLLTVNPSAFLFNQIAAAPIQNMSVAPAEVGPSGYESSGLRVSDGRSLLLVGGNINIDKGRLNAFGGRVELGGLKGQGTVGLNFSDNNLSLSFPNGIELADVSLTNGASVNVRASNSGSIAITARNIDITDFAQLNGGLEENLGFAGAQAGDIELHAQGAIRLANGFISNTVERGAVGKGGDINMKAGSLFMIDGAQLNTSTLSQYSLLDPLTQGNSGSVNINVRDTVSFDGEVSGIRATTTGAFSRVEDRAIGNSGDINITTRSLLVKNGAVLDASNSGGGSTGTININAHDTVSLDGDSSRVELGTFDGDSSGVELGTVGKEGDIRITTGLLRVTNGARINAYTGGQGKAGNVTVNASDLVEVNGYGSVLGTQVDAGAEGNGGDTQITTRRLTIRDGGQVGTGTFGQGNAGDLTINASDLVEVSGRASVRQPNGSFYPTGLFTQVEPDAGGNGGKLSITTPRLIISGGAVVSARSFGTDGKANAGGITVKASDSVEIIGTSIDGRDPSFLGASVGPVLPTDRVRGDAGDVKVETKHLIIRDGAVLSSRNVGEGTAGNLEVMAGSILLDKGEIRTETALGNGGNITLSDLDLLHMRRNSKITASAGGNAQAGGNGGNITINAPNGFIVARARENNDITANAFSGSGGRVTINATGIYGMTVRTREDLVRLLGTNLDPQQLPTNDITAISQTSPTLSGTVTINTSDVDPNRGLVNLPAIPVDTSVAQTCIAGGSQAQSKFIITGRGGLPQNPGETLTTDAVQVNLVTLNREVNKHSTTAVSTNSTKSATPPIVEATGWVKSANGDVVLTRASAPTAKSRNSWHQTPDCRALNQQQQR